MIGAIIGDIVGSRFEWTGNKRKRFALFTPSCRFTDDSLMTIAIAKAFLLHKGKWKEDCFQELVVEKMVKLGKEYAYIHTWGERFYEWFMGDHKPYFSFGNGAAMRVSPISWIAESEEDVKYFSKLVTEVSHNHPEGIKGAESVAMAIYLARIGTPKEDIRKRMIGYYPEIENMTVNGIRPKYGYDEAGEWVTCQGSVPQAIVCFLDSICFEDAIRNAVSLGADTDTQGCIAGSIAEAFYGIPPKIEEEAMRFLPEELQGICYAFSTIKLKRKKKGIANEHIC